MQVRLITDEPVGLTTGALVVPFFSDAPLEGVAEEVDAAAGGVIIDALTSGEVRGKLGDHVLGYAKGRPFRRVLAISLGDGASFEPYLLARYAGMAVRYLGRRNVEKIAIALPWRWPTATTTCAGFRRRGRHAR